jgi:hypothetical protein
MTTSLRIPGYENPVWRFLQGRGELTDSEGRATSLGEAIVHIRPEDYPLIIEGQTPTEVPGPLAHWVILDDKFLSIDAVSLTREQLLSAAYQLIEGDGGNRLEPNLNKIKEILKTAGYLA